MSDVDGATGHKLELKQNFSLFSMLGLAFAILNSWTALAASLSLALPSGGPSAILWGLVTAGVCNLCMAASLAELLSSFPSALGQSYWVAMLSPPKWMPLFSFITGWINTFGWVALTATGGSLGSQLIVGIIALEHSSYEAQRWHQFLIYVGYALTAFIINAFMVNSLPALTKAAFIWSIGGFAVISITLLACSHGEYQSANFVLTEFVNEVGWPDGVSWLLGLLQAAFGLTGFDAVSHLADEIHNPAVVLPKIMIYAVAIGLVTGFIFLTVLLFVLKVEGDVVSSLAGPLLEIFYQSTGNKVGAICLDMFPVICVLFASISIMTTSSRMTYAFARDGGLPGSPWLARVHPTLGVPLNALIGNTIAVIIFGCIFLGSSSALNAILSASVVALGISYGIPVFISVCYGRRKLPGSRSFKLPNALGWICNLVALAFTIVTTVFFVFPPALPVTGNNMNYCIVAFAVVIIISTFQWFVDGRKHFTGPRKDMKLHIGPAETTLGLETGSNDDIGHGRGSDKSGEKSI